MAVTTYKDNSAQVCGALDKALSLKAIHEHMSGKSGGVGGDDGYCDGMFRAIVMMATAGVGPDDVPYAAYSDSYQRQIDRAKQTGSKRFLRGLSNKGPTGGMLDRGRFSTKVDGNGDLWLLWTSDGSEKMDVYPLVHQGRLPGRGKTPVRKWFHLQTVGAANAVVHAYKLTVEDICAKFNAKGFRS